MRIGILTSGGDCPGLNAVIRGFGKYAFENIKNVELIGIADRSEEHTSELQSQR